MGKERGKRQYIPGYVYMIIWKPLVGKYLQCVNKPPNKVDKNAVSVVRANSPCKEEVVGHVQQNIFLITFMFLLLPITLWMSLQMGNALTMEVNMQGFIQALTDLCLLEVKTRS